ncbi:MAG TPA: carbonic anhydrase [Candidatus Gastranaerophilales bacterium]|nr:carbonic anhydrase [Candidatus Gastranaerophilales bacterium]
MNAKEALNLLIDGNNRFASSNHFFPNLIEERRLELRSGQNPFAVIISCSDSRVPAEIVFDRGLGDLFVIRNAGNIISSSVIGSVEYAVSYLNVSLILVLGHDDCGAINATLDNASESFFVRGIQEKILPAIEEAKNQNGDLVYNSVINNIKNQVNKLKTAGNIIPQMLNNEEIQILGGYYCLKSGKIDFFNI